MSKRTADWKGDPLTEEGKKFYSLRESGYTGPIDQDGNKAGCLMCGRMSCSRQGFAGKCD